MKKMRIALSFVLASSISSAAYAADGQINFTGEILDAACVVDNGYGGSQTVVLGPINKTSLATLGTTAAASQFTIKLKDCPTSVTAASVKFDGVTSNDNHDVLALSTGSTATGVGVAIFESGDQGTLIPVATKSASQSIDTANGVNTADLVYVAKYISTKDVVTAGSANAVTDFTIVYN